MRMPDWKDWKKHVKERRDGGYPWTRIQLANWGNSGAKTKVERDGKRLTLKNVEITEYWKNKEGQYSQDEIKDGTYTFEAPDMDQADSWYQTLTD